VLLAAPVPDAVVSVLHLKMRTRKLETGAEASEAKQRKRGKKDAKRSRETKKSEGGALGFLQQY
jgi:hypothetical protein